MDEFDQELLDADNQRQENVGLHDQILEKAVRLSLYTDVLRPEPPYQTEQGGAVVTVFPLLVNEAWCENCETVSTDGKCHCTEDGKEPIWRPHDRKAIETIADLRQRLSYNQQAVFSEGMRANEFEQQLAKTAAENARMRQDIIDCPWMACAKCGTEHETGIIETIADLRQQLAEKDSEIERLRLLAEGKLVEAAKLEWAKIEANPSGGYDVSAKAPMVALIAENLVQDFKVAGGANYVEWAFTHEDLGPFTITMQRREGKTPANVATEALADTDNLYQQLAAERERRIGAEARAAVYARTKAQLREEIAAERARREKAEDALKPFSAIVPSSLYGADGSENESYVIRLATTRDLARGWVFFTGADLARARAVSAPAQQQDAKEKRDFASILFEYNYAKDVFETALAESRFEAFETISGDSYDGSVEFYEVDDDAKLSADAQRVVFDAGFIKAFLNHLNGRETYYIWNAREFKPVDGFIREKPAQQKETE